VIDSPGLRATVDDGDPEEPLLNGVVSLAVQAEVLEEEGEEQGEEPHAQVLQYAWETTFGARKHVSADATA
jgi:hypothetical protein